MTSHKPQLWYVRRQQAVRGPYPQGQIVRDAVLGRIRPDDELSHDRENWQPLSALPALQPEQVYQSATPDGQRKLARARLHEDERRNDRRGTRKASGQERRGKDRRKQEPEEIIQHRQRMQRWAGKKSASPLNTRTAVVVLGIVVLALATYFVGYRPAPATGERDCRAAPAPGVNWSGCLLSGQLLTRADLQEARMDNSQLRRALLQGANLTRADLRYADLEGAVLQQALLRDADLTGAILRGATLAQADLRGADLRFANLVNASLNGAMLSGAKLDKAIWTDGRICAVNSRGGCQ